MKWLNNLHSLAENKGFGSCPYCKSENLDYGQNLIDEEHQMGYGVIWCNDCRKAFHISRIKIDKRFIKSIPSNLIFE